MKDCVGWSAGYAQRGIVRLKRRSRGLQRLGDPVEYVFAQVQAKGGREFHRRCPG